MRLLRLVSTKVKASSYTVEAIGTTDGRNHCNRYVRYI